MLGNQIVYNAKQATGRYSGGTGHGSSRYECRQEDTHHAGAQEKCHRKHCPHHHLSETYCKYS